MCVSAFLAYGWPPSSALASKGGQQYRLSQLACYKDVLYAHMLWIIWKKQGALSNMAWITSSIQYWTTVYRAMLCEQSLYLCSAAVRFVQDQGGVLRSSDVSIVGSFFRDNTAVVRVAPHACRGLMVDVSSGCMPACTRHALRRRMTIFGAHQRCITAVFEVSRWCWYSCIAGAALANPPGLILL